MLAFFSKMHDFSAHIRSQNAQLPKHLDPIHCIRGKIFLPSLQVKLHYQMQQAYFLQKLARMIIYILFQNFEITNQSLK